MGVARERQLLVVEDDDVLREALADALERHGYNVASAANGRVALDWLHHSQVRPSMIILDLIMPIMDGVAFLQYHAIDPSVGTVPVIVLTAKGAVAAELIGAVVAVLTKPVSLPRLLEIVQTACEDPLGVSMRTRPMTGDDSGTNHCLGDLERRLIPTRYTLRSPKPRAG